MPGLTRSPATSPATSPAASPAAHLSLVMLVAALAPSCSDYNVQLGTPTVELSSEIIDFGEIIVGNQSTIGILIQNTGDGPLTISSAALDGTTSADFTFLDLSSTTIDKGTEAELSIRYVPDVVGQDYGRVQLATNDDSSPILNVDLAGFGVEPAIDLDPDVLWFGDVAVGDSKSLSVTVSAQGTGTLSLTDIGLPDDLLGIYSWTLPTTVGLPYELPAGVSMDLVVTFSPSSDSETVGDLTLTSNDPHSRETSVQLLGNTVDDPTSNAPPVVSLNDPDWGAYFLSTDSVTLQGVAYDEEDDPTMLVCLAYAGATPIGTGSPDSDGNVSIATTDLPVGDVNLLLRCLDSQGSLGEDSVDVVVWDPEEPLSYVLSGGDTPFDWWAVDDDVSIYLDDVLIYADTNHTQDTHPPVTLDADVGQIIRVVVTDYNYCDTYLDPLKLHFGTSNRQDGLDGFCYSACPEHACYDSDYAGPWPGVVYEESFAVSIP